MDKSDKDLLLKAGIVVAAFFVVVKPVLNLLGVSDDDKNLVDTIDTAAPTENPFNAQSQIFRDAWAGELATNGEKALWDYWDAKYYDGTINDSEILRILTAAHKVYDAFSFWHNADVEAVQYAFSTLTDKVDVGAVASAMATEFDVDLWSYLKSGNRIFPWWRNGLSETDLAAIVKHVNALPDSID